jgi:anti-sigma factor ChrR (cupin superfamily)
MEGVMYLLSNNILILVTIFSALLSTSSIQAADKNQSDTSKPIMTQQTDMKFHPAPGLPPGAMITVVRGDISKAEPYTLRLKLPDCYVIPSHWHTNPEEVTVLSGTFNVGVGDKIDKTQSTALTAGGFQLVPGKTNHYVWSKGTTIVQLDGMGPRDTNFVNPKELIPLYTSNNQCP